MEQDELVEYIIKKAINFPGMECLFVESEDYETVANFTKFMVKSALEDCEIQKLYYKE